MKRFSSLLMAAVFGGFVLTSCDNEEQNIVTNDVPNEVMAQLSNLGFDTDMGVDIFEDGYLVEGDIYLTQDVIDHMEPESHIPHIEQYSTNNLVSGFPRVITMYASEGRKGYSPAMIAGLDEAIRRYNAENLNISFVRTTNSRTADIVMSRLSKRDERRGVLGSAGFPTASGDPYDEIKMSGILESRYGLSVDEIASIIAHEIGHCIGFRHTDYFDRSISCGGSLANEGDGGVGANHIPGTPTGADLAGNGSYMLACFNGTDRPFTNADRTALDFLY